MERLPETCSICPVREETICAGLSEQDLSALDRVAVRRTLPGGTVLFRAGEENLHCAHLLKGLVKLQIPSADGRMQTVAILGPGEFLGQLFEEQVRLTAIADGPVDLCIYSRVAVEGMALRRPAFMRALLAATSHSLEVARTRQASFARRSALARLAEYLVALPRDADRIAIPVSRTDLANYLGMPIETLSRQFARLKGEGVLEVNPGSKSIGIADPARLVAIAQGRE